MLRNHAECAGRYQSVDELACAAHVRLSLMLIIAGPASAFFHSFCNGDLVRAAASTMPEYLLP